MTDNGATPEIETATARCLWCGSERPVDVATCPTCSHAWIDATIDEARAVGFAEPADATQAETSRPPLWRRRSVLVGLALAVVAVYGVILLLDPGAPIAATNQAPTTIAAPSSTAAPTTLPPTTLPPTTLARTTLPPTTTTSTTTLPPITVVEPGFDPRDLTLGAFALGPIDFGTTDADLPGRLAATFGQPTAILPANENWGLCENETGRVLEFGSLSVIMRDVDGGEELVGYRHRGRLDRELDPDPSGDLRTISGLVLFNNLSDVTRLYSRVATAELAEQQDETLPPGSPIYIVQRSSDGRTLIWGKLSGDEDPEVLSINSPNACDAGPSG